MREQAEQSILSKAGDIGAAVGLKIKLEIHCVMKNIQLSSKV
jgi:hypothetical protein